jgi:peptidoglycan/LPS O-acetylase OafA/YrhL
MTSAQSPYETLKYRPDIDGLRAISILGVLIFHAFPQSMRGGFVGVDVFFVISGFLIGGLIFDEVSQGHLSFTHFYARRVRRILPALIVVLVATYLAGWFILFPDEYRQLGKQVAAAATFASNFVLLQEAGYFDTKFQTKPLLHLWSLAVEEQFYLVWPVYVWLTIRNRSRFLFLTLALCAISFALSVVLPSREAAFYLPVSRFWEILSGSLLAYAVRRPLPPVVLRWREQYCWPGLALIVVALFVTPAADFPGWWGLPPVLGTCLLIFAGPGAWLNRRVLALRGMVFIGLISYPLYLWHWPLISYAWILDGSAGYEQVFGAGPAALTKFALLACAFVLACLTYFFVERPVRAASIHLRKAAVVAALLLMLGIGGGVTMALGGIPTRAVATANQSMAEDTRIPTDTRISDSSCIRLFGLDVGHDSVCLANSSKPIALFVGDSQAMALYSSIFRARMKIPSVLLAGHDDHPECFKRIDFEQWIAGTAPCQNLVRSMFQLMQATPSIRTVVVHYQDDGRFYLERDKIERMQAEFLKNGRDVVYVLGEPGFWRPITECSPRQIVVLGFDLSPRAGGLCRQERKTLVDNQINQRKYIASMSNGDPAIHVYDPLRALCDDQYCYQAGPDGAWFWSLEHVNEKGSVRILNDFLPWAKQNLRHFDYPS